MLTAEHEVRHLSELFQRNIDDKELLAALARQGEWVVLSGDTRISKSPQERMAWIESKLILFFLAKGWMKQPLEEQAWWLVRWWPKILQQAPLVAPGTGFEIPAKSHGVFRLVTPSP